MRTTDARMKHLRRRTAALKAENAKKRQYGIDLLCTAVCLLLIVGLGVAMPHFADATSGNGILHTSGAATLIGNNTALGYILMGVLAFFLGVCCTVLLYRLHRRKKHGEDSDEL